MPFRHMYTCLLCILLALAVNAEEWTGRRVIDQPLTVSAPVLNILPGTQIVFQGKGRLIFNGQKLDIQGATFSAAEVLQNAPRISLKNTANQPCRIRITKSTPKEQTPICW